MSVEVAPHPSSQVMSRRVNSVFSNLLMWCGKVLGNSEAVSSLLEEGVDWSTQESISQFVEVARLAFLKKNRQIEQDQVIPSLISWITKTCDPFGVDVGGVDSLRGGLGFCCVISALDSDFEYEREKGSLLSYAWKYLLIQEGRIEGKVKEQEKEKGKEEEWERRAVIGLLVLCYLGSWRLKEWQMSVSYDFSGKTQTQEEKKSARRTVITGHILSSRLPSSGQGIVATVDHSVSVEEEPDDSYNVVVIDDLQAPPPTNNPTDTTTATHISITKSDNHTCVLSSAEGVTVKEGDDETFVVDLEDDGGEEGGLVVEVEEEELVAEFEGAKEEWVVKLEEEEGTGDLVGGAGERKGREGLLSVVVEKGSQEGLKKEEELEKVMKRLSRRSASIRVQNGMVFTNEAFAEEVEEKEKEKKKIEEEEAFSKMKFEVKYSATIVRVGESVVVEITVQNLPEDIFTLPTLDLQVVVQLPQKKKREGEGGSKVVEKFVAQLKPGVSKYDISFPCLVTGVYKVQVIYIHPLQSKRCRIRSMAKRRAMGGATAKKRESTNSEKRRAEVMQQRRRARTAAAEPNPSQRRKKKAGEEEGRKRKGKGQEDGGKGKEYDSSDEEVDEVEVREDVVEVKDDGQEKKRLSRRSMSFRKGNSMSFKNESLKKDPSPATNINSTSYQFATLRQDFEDLKPRVLMSRVNVIVTYPRQRFLVGESVFAEVILHDSQTGKPIGLADAWKLDMKVELPDGKTETCSCKTDPTTELIYGSYVTLTPGTFKAQIIFNAYPVQNRRCKLMALKTGSMIAMAPRSSKSDREMLDEIKTKRVKKDKKKKEEEVMPLSAKRAGKKGKEEGEIKEMKRLMETTLGHTVRVGVEGSLQDGEEKEIQEKRELMERELGVAVTVRRRGSSFSGGNYSQPSFDEAKSAGKSGGKKLNKEEEIAQKRQLMELALGDDVRVQQVHIEEVSK